MKIRDLRKRAKYWQGRLGLKDWNVAVHWGVKTPGNPNPWNCEMTEDSVGNSTWSVEEAKAVILLDKRAPEVEETLLHELMHVRMEGHAPIGKYDAHYERGINALVKALMEDQ